MCQGGRSRSRLFNNTGLFFVILLVFTTTAAGAAATAHKPFPFPHPDEDVLIITNTIALLQDSIIKAADSKDIRRLKELRASVVSAIADIDVRIARIDSVRAASKQKDKGLGGAIISGIANNFRERKLTWLKDTRYFLSEEKDHIDAIIGGVSRANVFASSRLDALKIKVASAVKGLF